MGKAEEGKAVSRKDVEYLGRLGKINLTDSEMDGFVRDFAKIIGYVSQLAGVDTDDVEPAYHVQPLSGAFRTDAVESSRCAGEILDNAPLTEGAFFKVPRIIAKQ